MMRIILPCQGLYLCVCIFLFISCDFRKKKMCELLQNGTLADLLISIFLFHGWNTLPESLNDPPLMSHATNSTPPDDNIDIHAVIRHMQNCIQQQQDRIQQLEAATSEQD